MTSVGWTIFTIVLLLVLFVVVAEWLKGVFGPVATLLPLADESQAQPRGSVAAEEARPTARDLELGAMHALWPLPRVLPTFVQSQEEIDHAVAEAARKRKWVEETIHDQRTKRAYLALIEFCENDNAEAQREFNTGAQRKARERRMKKWNDEHARGKALNLPKPPVQ